MNASMKIYCITININTVTHIMTHGVDISLEIYILLSLKGATFFFLNCSIKNSYITPINYI